MAGLSELSRISAAPPNGRRRGAPERLPPGYGLVAGGFVSLALWAAIVAAAARVLG